MFGALARWVFGSANDRIVKDLKKQVDAINALEPEFSKLSDEALAAKTVEYRQRLADGATLDSLTYEAFATVREAAKRTLGQRHFDTQLMGGLVLHSGKIAEMRTGEGKTLVATLAVYLNALTGKGVHVVTVNDYLARRDSEWMGQVYKFLGLTVGAILHGMDDSQRRAAYACDVTYATNNELGFDYLRDNMKFRLEEMVHRNFNYAIVDEVDSILVDEARTPLIISGPTEDNSELYRQIDALMPHLTEADYEKDEKQRSVNLTEEGVEHVEQLLIQAGMLSEGGNLYDIHNVTLVHHVQQALRAHRLFTRDVDYIVKDRKVIIIDEFTGRMMEGRRYSDGLHQALEAKENADIQNENQTLASITFQNLFRLYPKLSGMTGTAMTEAGEFAEIYKLDVVEMPTNNPIQRIDADDEVYRTAAEKYAAIADLVAECQARNQPVLVGTTSIEKSEMLSELFKKKGVTHNVLNARFHEQEAMIVAQAGKPGAVTIATNMAGRGTDIQLGGNADMRIAHELAGVEGEEFERRAQIIRDEVQAAKEQVLAAGGLYIIGTERHESRRIDNQLRGRAGRQGDPGGSKFFLSLEDDLMRIFGSQRMDGMLRRLGLKEGEAIIHPWINKALEKAQQKVEARNFDIRKNLLKFDDVMNDQRKVIYEQRKELMQEEDVADVVATMRQDTVEGLIARHIPEKAYAEQWDVKGLNDEVMRIFNLQLPILEWGKEEGIADEEIQKRLMDAVNRKMAGKVAEYGPEVWRMVEKSMLLQILDQIWKEHLLQLDHLRQGIGLRAYGQRDPLNEYKREAFNLFDDMLGELREKVTSVLAHVQLRVGATEDQIPQPQGPKEMHESHDDPAFASAGSSSDALPERVMMNTPRNAPCPCGSGRKFKHCHGAVE